MLEFKNLHIGYKKVLFEVKDLTLNSGQLVSVIGKNGTGKTTFLNTILGINKPLQGTVKVSDRNIQELKRNELVTLFSHVSSKFDGVNYLSVYDLIAMGRAPYTNMLNQLREVDREIINSVIEKLNLTKLKDYSTSQISDGERQIAIIGKALAQQTKIIILDEPTAFLDYTNRRKVIKLLKEIAVEQDKLILISTHNIDLCIECSDLIIAVDDTKKSIILYQDKMDKSHLIEEVFGN
ncbi:MAG: ABC transporter ATP-binding protein [Brumimicrobium sp.]